MFPETYAAPIDIEDVFRPLTEAESTIALGLIAQASNKLRARIPNIDALVTEPFRQALARDAVVNAVKRLLMNPEAVRQVTETRGPYSDSKTIDSSVSSALLYIDPEDLVGLIPTPNRHFRTFRVRSGLHR